MFFLFMARAFPVFRTIVVLYWYVNTVRFVTLFRCQIPSWSPENGKHFELAAGDHGRCLLDPLVWESQRIAFSIQSARRASFGGVFAVGSSP